MWTPLFKRMESCFISETSFSKKLHKQKHCVASRITLSGLELPVCVIVWKVHPKIQRKRPWFYARAQLGWRVSTCFCVRFLSILGVLVALHFGLDGSLHVEKRERSRQFLYPIPDRAGRPVGNRLPGSQLPLLVGHRGPGQWCGWLRSFFDLQIKLFHTCCPHLLPWMAAFLIRHVA